MPEATILFDNQELIRTLFGPRDRHLRDLRDALDLEAVLRGNELTIRGTHESVAAGRDAIEQMCQVIEAQKQLSDSEVRRVLGQQQSSKGSSGQAIDIRDRGREIHPRSEGQAHYVRSIQKNDLVFCAGPAGCGKTFLAVATAVAALRAESVRKIVLVRPAVEAGEKLGYLPGDMLAKVNPFLRPLLDALNELLGFDQVRRYMDEDVIEIVPLAFMRGRTLNQTFIILDEAQNTTITQMKMFLTRMGMGSKIVVTGDATQTDLDVGVRSGLIDAVERLSKVRGVGTVTLTGADIVRHPLVREIVEAYEEPKSGRRN